MIHRRFGKSYMAINYMIERAVECPFPAPQYAYCCKTAKDAKRISWKYLLRFTEGFPGRVVNIGELTVSFPTRAGYMASISLYGLDTHQQIRGLYLDGAILDEWAQINFDTWQEQIRPMLADAPRRGKDLIGKANQWAIFIFTPYGRNHAYEMHETAKLWSSGEPVVIIDPETGMSNEVREKNWHAAEYPASETKLISKEELDAIRNQEIAVTGGDAKYQQEFEIRVDANVPGAIFTHQLNTARRDGRICEVPWVSTAPVHVGIDIGHDDPTAIWFVQVLNGQYRWIDFASFRRGDLEKLRDILAQKSEERGFRYDQILVPHDIKNTELGTGKSRLAILRELGVRAFPIPKVQQKADAIAAARYVFTRSWWDMKWCREGLDHLAMYRWKVDPRTGVVNQKEPVHDKNISDCADAAMTFCLGARKISDLRAAGEYQEDLYSAIAEL